MNAISTPPRPSRLAGPSTPSRSPYRPTPTKRAPLGDADHLANSLRAFQEKHASDYAHLHVTDNDSDSVRRLKLEAEEKRLEEERRIGRAMRERLGKGLGTQQPELVFQLPSIEQPAAFGHARTRSAWRPLSLTGKRGPGHSRAQSQGTIALGTQPLRPMSSRPKVARLSMAVLKTGRSVSDSPMRTPTLDRVEEHDVSPLAQQQITPEAADSGTHPADVSLNKSTYSWATSFSGETEELRAAAAYVPRLSLDDEVEELEERQATPDRTKSRRKRIVAIAHTARQLEGIGSREPEDPEFWPILERAWNERPGMEPAQHEEEDELDDDEEEATPHLEDESLELESYEEDESRLRPNASASGRQAPRQRNTLTDSPPDLDFRTPAMQDQSHVGEPSQAYIDDLDYSYSDESRSHRYSYASSLHDLGTEAHRQGVRLTDDRAWLHSSAQGRADGWQSRWSGAAGNWEAPPPLQTVPEQAAPVEKAEESGPQPKLDSPIRLPPLPGGRALKRVDGSVHQAGLNSAGPSKWGLGFIGGWWADPSSAPGPSAPQGTPHVDQAEAETEDMTEVDFRSGEAGAHLAPLPYGPPPLQGTSFPLPTQHDSPSPLLQRQRQSETRAWSRSGGGPGPELHTPPNTMPARLELPPPPRAPSRAEMHPHPYPGAGGPNASLSSSHFLRQSLIRSMDSCIDENPDSVQEQSLGQDTLDLAWDGPDAEGEDDSQWLQQQEMEMRGAQYGARQVGPRSMQNESYGYSATEVDELSMSRLPSAGTGRMSVETMETTSDVHGLVAMIAHAEAMLETAQHPTQTAGTEGRLGLHPDQWGMGLDEQPRILEQEEQAEEAGSPMGSDGSQTSSSLFNSMNQLPLPPPRPDQSEPPVLLPLLPIDFTQSPLPSPSELAGPPMPPRSRQLSLSNLLNPAEEPFRPSASAPPAETASAATAAPAAPPTHSVPPRPTRSISPTTPSRPSSLSCSGPLAQTREPTSADIQPCAPARPQIEPLPLPATLGPEDHLQSVQDSLKPEEEQWFSFPNPAEHRAAERARMEARTEAYEMQRAAVRPADKPELRLPLPVYIDTVSPASTTVPALVSRSPTGPQIRDGSAPASSMAWLTRPAPFFWLGWVLPFLWILGGWVYAPPVPVLVDASGERVGVDVENQKGEMVPQHGFMRLMYHPDPWVRACRWGTVVGVPSVMAAGLAVIVCLAIIR